LFGKGIDAGHRWATLGDTLPAGLRDRALIGFMVYFFARIGATRTTQLYDRRRDEVSLDEVERIVI
jgi:hypothetical protein